MVNGADVDAEEKWWILAACEMMGEDRGSRVEKCCDDYAVMMVRV